MNAPRTRGSEGRLLDVLSVGGKPAAMHFGFHHPDAIYWYKPAFDLELSKGSPGRVLLAHLFARADAQGLDRVDLLKGTEDYKTDWANHSRETITSTLIARTPRELVRALTDRWNPRPPC